VRRAATRRRAKSRFRRAGRIVNARGRLLHPPAQAIQAQVDAAGKAGRRPHHHRHALVRLGCDRAGQAVQPQAVRAFVETMAAAAVLAQAGRVEVDHLVLAQARAHALAAGLVVAPMHLHAGTRHDMQQRLAAPDARGVVVAPATAANMQGSDAEVSLPR
jgi:hypothetical protein